MSSAQSGKGLLDGYNVMGGVGRIVYAPTTTSYPSSISDVLSDPENGTLASGWTDMGATDGGFTFTPSADKEDWEVDQVNTPIDQFITRWNFAVEFTLAELSLENMQMLWQGATITTNSTPTPDERTAKFGAVTEMTKRILVYIHDKKASSVSGEGRLRMFVFRRAAYDGSDTAHAFQKGQKALLPARFQLFADTDITAANEQVWYVIDQIED